MKRMFFILLALCALPTTTHARTYTSVGVGIGSPGYYDPYPYRPYPPAYYAYPAPPPYVVEEPAYYNEPPISYAPEELEVCREYTGKATIDGKRKTVYGRACRQDDGSWQMVN